MALTRNKQRVEFKPKVVLFLLVCLTEILYFSIMIKKHKNGEQFYGTTTLGEKGQVVIPAEARKVMGIKKGDKLLVFGIAFLIFRRPIWELGGWLIHILLDIPTHSYRFFPTPVFWPFSGWKFNGLSWATPWFLIVNYAAIIIIYLLLRRKKELGQTQ